MAHDRIQAQRSQRLTVHAKYHACVLKTQTVMRSKAIFGEDKQILKMTSIAKGSKDDLSTFKKWRKDGVIGYKTVKDGIIKWRYR